MKPVTKWVGWQNYGKIFNASFSTIIVRTFIWTALSVGMKMVIGICGAVLLNAALPGRTLFRILLMPPWIVPMAIGIFMWGWMYNGQFGMISGLLQNFGITSGPVAFLAYGKTAFWATIVTDVWIGVPLVTIYLLAAMQSIPRDLYEAAWVDGAGRFYRFRRITLPMIVPALVTMSMISLISTFNSFDIIWILTARRPKRRNDHHDHRHLQDSNRLIEIRRRCCARRADLRVPVLFCFVYFRVVSRSRSAGDRLAVKSAESP